MYLEFYKNKFEREQKRRVDLDNAMNLPILVLTLIMGLNSYILKEHAFAAKYTVVDWVVLTLLSASVLFILMSCYYIILTTNKVFKKKSFLKAIDYPSFDLMYKYREIELHNEKCEDENKINIEKLITEKTIKYSDEYTIINDERADNFSKARQYLIFSFLVVIISISIITIQNLSQ